MNLNENQMMAVKHVDGPCMVLAGPGSGKTRVITHRINNLIEFENINPRNILAISFTKASSIEMKNRCANMSQKINMVSFGTFHSVFFKILRGFNLNALDDIISESDKLKSIKNILKSINCDELEEEDVITSISNEISLCKNELINVNKFDNKVLKKDDFIRVYTMYEDYKKQMKKIDFDDMLVDCYDFLKSNEKALNMVRARYKYILVDEFQDINKVQFEVLKLISKENIFVVGDEDQSIYGFRGARPDFLLEFEKHFDHCKRILLDTNYRCDKNIIDASNNLINHNKNRYDKDIKPFKDAKHKIEYITLNDAEEESKKIGSIILDGMKKNHNSYSDFAVIYRTNVQSRSIIDVFLDLNIPFVVRDTVISIYDHWICKDIISYLKCAKYKTLKTELGSIINKPFRYISRDSIKLAMNEIDFLKALKSKCDLKARQIKTIEELEKDLDYLKNLSPKNAISYIRNGIEYDKYLVDYCQNRHIKSNGLFEILNEIESSANNFKTIDEYLSHIEKVKNEIVNQKKQSTDDRVTLTTMHSAKGLEFNTVFIVGALEGVIPHEKSESDIEEERRLFYVAITRAMEKLYISYPKNRFNKQSEKSRFVDELKGICTSFGKEKELSCVKIGDMITHKTFKDGKIIGKDGEKVKVKFDCGTKIINYIFCLKNDLIKMISKEKA